MKEPEIEYRNTLVINLNELEVEYDIDTLCMFVNWIDDNCEENSVLVYDTEWHLEESPIKDSKLLDFYLKTFKEFK